MTDTIELKKFRHIISQVGKDVPEYRDVSTAILDNLNSACGGRTDKNMQQNILNSFMKAEILDMMISSLPEQFDYERHSFARKVIDKLEEEVTLY